MELSDGWVFDAGREVMEGFSEGEVAHYVEGVVIEPAGGLDGLGGMTGELGDELGGVLCDAVFVEAECLEERQSPARYVHTVLNCEQNTRSDILTFHTKSSIPYTTATLVGRDIASRLEHEGL